MRWWWLVVLSIGCRERAADIRRAPERELPRTPPTAPFPSVIVTSLVGYAGETVSVRGRVAPRAKPRIPWSVPGKSSLMIDLSESHLTIAAHTVDHPTCSGDVVLTGHVIVARGMIRQGTTEGDWAEPQLDVTGWICP